MRRYDYEEPIDFTREQLEQLAPRPFRESRVDSWDAFLDTLTSEDGRVLLVEADISTSARRLSHFLAQLAHESDGFSVFEENLNYSAERLQAVFGRRYFKSRASARRFHRNPEAIANHVYADKSRLNKLGNVEEGDGWCFRGRGPIQITGRDAYTRLSREIGVDLVDHPEQLLEPLVGLKAAIWFWRSRNLNALASSDRIGRITKLVNGGYNGLEHRKLLYARAWAIWGEFYTSYTTDQDIALLQEGADGIEVTALQQRLKDLRYPVGAVDGHFGEQTHIALLAFQELSGLHPDGIYGPQTRKLLATAQPRDLGARAETTVEEHREKSPTAKKGGFLKWLASGAMALFGIDGASEAGALGWITGLGDNAGALKGAFAQIIPFLEFASSHLFWVLGLLAAAGVWWWTSKITTEQLDNYRNGINLEG